jgi:membrane-associated phospholipid phosphatase
VIPVVAYSAAALVAFDRVNDRVHFASDVAAGAILGTTIGRFIVRRHMQAQERTRQKPVTDIQLLPIPGGLAARVTF